MTVIEKLKVIQDQVANCTKCELHKTRTNTVFSRGNPFAAVCCVGEAAGQAEDEQGKPFVGKSGQLLDQAITELGYNPANDIYVANIVKCRPPENRRPELDETWSCYPYLEQQLALIKAKVIIALGNTSSSVLLKTGEGITKIRGKEYRLGERVAIGSFHPSFILRNGGTVSEQYRLFKNDLQLAFKRSREV